MQILKWIFQEDTHESFKFELKFSHLLIMIGPVVSDFKDVACLHVWRVPVWFGRTVWELWELGEQRGNVLLGITVIFRLYRPNPI